MIWACDPKVPSLVSRYRLAGSTHRSQVIWPEPIQAIKMVVVSCRNGSTAVPGNVVLARVERRIWGKYIELLNGLALEARNQQGEDHGESVVPHDKLAFCTRGDQSSKTRISFKIGRLR